VNKKPYINVLHILNCILNSQIYIHVIILQTDWDI